MPFLIDGYNLLRTVEKTADGPDYINDVSLCHIIDKYMSRVYDKSVIVFDGIGPPDKSGFESLCHVEVFFSGMGREADELIEERIGSNTAPKRLTVVSSDRRLRKAARRRRSDSIKSDSFWRKMRKEFMRKRGTGEPSGKRVGISEYETEEWMRIFGFKK